MSEENQRAQRKLVLAVALLMAVPIGFSIVHAYRKDGEEKMRREAGAVLAYKNCETRVRMDLQSAKEVRDELAQMEERIGKKCDPRVKREMLAMVETFREEAERFALDREVMAGQMLTEELQANDVLSDGSAKVREIKERVQKEGGAQ